MKGEKRFDHLYFFIFHHPLHRKLINLEAMKNCARTLGKAFSSRVSTCGAEERSLEIYGGLDILMHEMKIDATWNVNSTMGKGLHDVPTVALVRPEQAEREGERERGKERERGVSLATRMQRKLQWNVPLT